MKERNKHVGSSLDEFLKEEGRLREAKSVAAKETAKWLAKQQKKEDKSEPAKANVSRGDNCHLDS